MQACQVLMLYQQVVRFQTAHLVPSSKASPNQVCPEVLDFADKVEHGLILHPVPQRCKA